MLSDAIVASGVPSLCLDDVGAIREALWKEIPRGGVDGDARDVVFVMSNGSFDGLNELLRGDLLSA